MLGVRSGSPPPHKINTSSTKAPFSVDECNSTHRFIHKNALQRGQMQLCTLFHPQKCPSAWTNATLPLFHPQKHPPAWTNATLHIVSSTKMPSSVDKCNSTHRFIHKNTLQRGQMQLCHCFIHKNTLQRGQMQFCTLFHPQKHPPAWMKPPAPAAQLPAQKATILGLFQSHSPNQLL